MNNYVSLDYILNKLNDDWGFEEELSVAADRLQELIDIVNDPDSFEEDFVEIPVEDYRGTLPTDFYKIQAANIKVNNNTLSIPLTDNSDRMSRFSTTRQNTPDTAEYTYEIKQGYIFTGFESGTVELSYKKRPINPTDGLPYIPDDAKTIRVMVNLLAMMKGRKLYLANKLDERRFQYINQEYLHSLASWSNHLKGFTPEEAEVIKNRYLKLNDNPIKHFNNFKTHGYQHKYLHNHTR